MKSKLLILSVMLLLGITSCARHATCPTYSDQELKEIKVNSDHTV